MTSRGFCIVHKDFHRRLGDDCDDSDFDDDDGYECDVQHSTAGIPAGQRRCASWQAELELLIADECVPARAKRDLQILVPLLIEGLASLLEAVDAQHKRSLLEQRNIIPLKWLGCFLKRRALSTRNPER
uniref:Uncharacterized protein n=1 Tax=Lotharella oceanica TaxID=641309 RepID=A0A7S2TH28_9EUKA|mmetsp:Transcript_1390/g.2629  ORF Transcript_1390/g.2629 Transcript_1390/m.2629 type:complete len:129 (+) Transcript_1390:1-387(+)